jgi:uncharacterized delta-60 repeat protein
MWLVSGCVLMIAVVCWLALVSVASAAPGELATEYGDGGHYAGRSGPGALDEVEALPDGRLMGLSLQQYGGGPLVLTRFRAHGPLDPSFGESGGSVETGVRRVGRSALAVRADGRTLVAGTQYLHTAPSRYVFYVEQYRPDGRLDPAFGKDGRVEVTIRDNAANLLTAVEMLPDGRLVLGGRSESYAGSLLVFARLLPDGRLDGGFGGGDGVAAIGLGGRRFPDRPLDLLLREDGAILASGASSVRPLVRRADPGYGYPVSEIQQPALVQLRPDGELDARFGKRGLVVLTNPDDEGALVEIVERARGGLAALQAPISPYDGSDSVVLRGFRADGPVDRRFGRRGRSAVRLPRSYRYSHWTIRGLDLVAQPDGKLLALGDVQNCYDSRGGGCPNRIGLARLLASGRPDPEWGRSGRGLVITRGPSLGDGFYGRYSDAQPRDLLLGPLGNPLVVSRGYLFTLYQDSVAPLPDRAVPTALAVERGRVATMAVGCREAGPSCTARVVVSARGRMVGGGRIEFTPGDTATVTIPLSRRGRALVEEKGRVRVRLQLLLDDRTGNTFSLRRRCRLVG